MTRRILPVVAACLLAAAATARAQTVAGSFDQVYTGPRNTSTTDQTLSSSIRTARSDAFTLASLNGGSATLRTTIRINAQGANADDQLPISVFGFLRNVDAAGNPVYYQARYDDDPLIYFQTNSGQGPGTGMCVNNEFNRNGDFSGGNFVFGTGNYRCAVPYDNATQTNVSPGSFANYTLRLSSDGSYTGRVDFLDDLGRPVTNPANFPTGSVGFLSFSGTVADLTASYTPFLRLRPGYDTGAGLSDPDTPWAFIVTNSALDISAGATAVPEPAAVALVGVGLAGLAAVVRRRRV